MPNAAQLDSNKVLIYLWWDVGVVTMDFVWVPNTMAVGFRFDTIQIPCAFLLDPNWLPRDFECDPSLIPKLIPKRDPWIVSHSDCSLVPQLIPFILHLASNMESIGTPMGCQLDARWMPIGFQLGAAWMPVLFHLDSSKLLATCIFDCKRIYVGCNSGWFPRWFHWASSRMPIGYP